jgi:CRISPR-associated protein Cas1
MQLIINKKGGSLAVKNGRFWVRVGDQEHFIAANQLKSIELHAATKVTYEAIYLSVENQIDLQFIDRKGFPFGRIWSNRFGSISTIRKNQVSFAASAAAPDWIRNTLIRKIENQLTMVKVLNDWQPNNSDIANVTSIKIKSYQTKLKKYQVSDSYDAYATFRGLEGACSKNYFAFINKTIPTLYSFTHRSKHPSRDMFNCLLNYAYGMLYGKVEAALIKAGIDPFLGIMHRDEYNRPVLTYDFIEVFRFWADYVVCHLCFQEVIYPDFFDIEQGNYWLNSSGKRILIHTFNDYLSEVVSISNLSRSRSIHIELEAQKLASKLKTFT